MIVWNSKNKLHLADKPFAKGGEGSIYNVIGYSELVAKLYHPAGRTDRRLKKLTTMLQNPPDKSLGAQIAWPLDILYDSDGNFLGFVMPRIRNVRKIDILYSYDNRNRHPFGWYIQVAQNLCAAVYAVHQSGHCCGDLNPANICVEEATGLVTLVDTDSYHARAPLGEVFPCVVCMPAYAPAELHRLMNQKGFDLRRTIYPTFTKETDLFALAIHIFALLMNGCHPFACIAPKGVSSSQFQLIGNIEKGVFPFVKNIYDTGIPKYAPALTVLPPRLQKLFIEAFVYGHNNPKLRPTPIQWHEALSELEEQLVRCPVHKEHQYWQGDMSCPWCYIERTMSNALTKKPISVKKKSVQTPKPVTAPIYNSPPPVPSPPIQTHKRFFFKTQVQYVLLHVISAILWLGWNLFALWLLFKVVPFSSWWLYIIRYLMLGLIPFVPLWFIRFMNYIDLGGTVIWDFDDIFSEYSRYAAILTYAGIPLLLYWGTGLINMVLGPILASLPVIYMIWNFPDWTS